MSAPALLAAPDLDRLAKLCGLFGSDHDGERAAAALKADELVRGRGATWAGLLAPLKPAPQLQHWDDAAECLAVAGWTAHERDFLTNMGRKRKAPTPAQREWLDALLARARMARAA